VEIPAEVIATKEPKLKAKSKNKPSVHKKQNNQKVSSSSLINKYFILGFLFIIE
jgi:hypothetical protein